MVRVLVEPTEDRWIHFPDGNKVRHGMEVSHMLNQFLYETEQFRVQIPQALDGIGVNPIVDESLGAKDLEELKARLPNHNLSYLEDKFPQYSYGAEKAHMIVRPRVHTLLYASGKRSNRVVYGFSPDRLNPYNNGTDQDGLDNDFTASQFDEVKQCSTLDFFDGQLKPRGWAHKRSNFGADADEGFSFEILGFGISFKKKSYAIKLGITFDVFFPHQNLHRSFDYEFKATGKDLSVGASYAGVHLGLEQQRRFTMRNAIEEGLPQLMEEFLKDMPPYLWQGHLKQSITGAWHLNAGAFDGLQIGQLLESQTGNRYVVVEAYPEHSAVIYAIDNESMPENGEIVRAVPRTGESPWPQAPGIGRGIASKLGSFEATQTMLSSKANQPISKKLSGSLSSFTQPEIVEKTVGNCAEKKHSWWERLVMSIMTFYAQWRFDNVYDQEFPANTKISSMDEGAPRVALISSGVYPYEKGLEQHLSNTGFDFISWDNRPSDDLGVGTAAAKYLAKKSGQDFVLIPVKVFGAHGETHSSAVYSAMNWVSERKDIDIVLVPWIPKVFSRAYKEGLRKMVASGKTVIAPKGTNVYRIVSAPEANKKYKTKGIRKAKLQLSTIGVGVMELGAEYIDNWTVKKGRVE